MGKDITIKSVYKELSANAELKNRILDRLRRNDDLNQVAKVLYEMQTRVKPFPIGTRFKEEVQDSEWEQEFVMKETKDLIYAKPFVKYTKYVTYSDFCDHSDDMRQWVEPWKRVKHARQFIDDCLGANPLYNVWEYDLKHDPAHKSDNGIDPLIEEFKKVFIYSRRRLCGGSPE